MMDLSMFLSENFTLGELLRSDIAERNEDLKREQYNPPPEIVANLHYLVKTALQPIRSMLGFPLRISSGYRCAGINKLAGGSTTSQPCLGEAADSSLFPGFLTDPATAACRNEVESRVRDALEKPLRPDVSPDFYLFAHLCLHLEELDVDQVIHEYGEGFGQPAWAHVSSSKRQDKRQILMFGKYTDNKYVQVSPEEALWYGVVRS
jgi:hypothetical protein